jgi:hypothetical protein
LTFFFLYSTQVGFFWGTFVYLIPHAYLGFTYLPTFIFLAYALWFPPSPTYLLACPSTHNKWGGLMVRVFASIPKVKGSNFTSDVVCRNGILIEYFPIEVLE